MPANRTLEDGARARLETRVHNEVANGFRAIADQRGCSVATVVRDAMYDFVNAELGLSLEPLATTYNRK